MFKWFENLPVELVGTNVLGMLGIRDIVILERACGSKASYQHFMNMIPYCTPVVLPSMKHDNISSSEWFAKRRCKITSLTITLCWNNATFHVKNLQVDNINLRINSKIDMYDCQPLFESDLRYKVKSIDVPAAAVDKEIMEQLSIFTENIVKLQVVSVNSSWITENILSRWKLKEIILVGTVVNKVLLTLIVQTCTELTSITLDYACAEDDALVNIIVQHCHKLEKLILSAINNITYNSLIALSERGLPSKELDIPYIPNIPTVNIARRCSHALSCIRHLYTNNLHRNGLDASTLLTYTTGLTSVNIKHHCNSYIPLLTLYCHKLTSITLDLSCYGIYDVLPLCHVNHIQQFRVYNSKKGTVVTDTALIELIHACPHLHALYLPYETEITDIGILALSEHCPQLQWLDVRRCTQVTDAAVLQLLQRCRKLTRLQVSSSSLSEETWAQLDKNTKNRVSRYL